MNFDKPSQINRFSKNPSSENPPSIHHPFESSMMNRPKSPKHNSTSIQFFKTNMHRNFNTSKCRALAHQSPCLSTDFHSTIMTRLAIKSAQWWRFFGMMQGVGTVGRTNWTISKFYEEF